MPRVHGCTGAAMRTALGWQRLPRGEIDADLKVVVLSEAPCHPAADH